MAGNPFGLPPGPGQSIVTTAFARILGRKKSQGTPVIPVPDEEDLARQARRRLVRRGTTGRAYTAMGYDDGFGG